MNSKVVSNYRLLCQNGDGCLSYHKGILYFSESLDGEYIKILDLAQSSWKLRVKMGIRLFERLLRLEPRFAIPAEKSKYYISWNCAMYMLDVSQGSMCKLFDYRRGMHNPLALTHIEGNEKFSDGYYFGEYWGNVDREDVKIFRLTDTNCECAYTFHENSILHVHGITADSKTGRVLICTGDTDEESGIWEAFDDFKSVKPLLLGSQKYRSCSAYVTDRGILYSTDTPLCENGIYLFDETQKCLQLLYKMPGPCIYSMKLKKTDGTEMYVFATSVEPDSTLSAIRYRLTYKLGVGVKTRYTHIIAGNLEEGFQDIAQFKKDILPMWLFQFGNVQFPCVDDSDHLLCTGQSLKKISGKTIAIL